MGEGAGPLTPALPYRPRLFGVIVVLLISPTAVRGGVLVQDPDTVSGQSQDTVAAQVPDSLAQVLATEEDTIVGSFPVFPELAANAPGVMYRWTNAEILNSGALTIGDLLEILPEPDPIRAGFLEGPQTSVFGGSGPAGYRMGVDGYLFVPFGGASVDQHRLDLVSQEGLVMVREPGGVRLVAEPYRNRKRDPYSRIEAGTGDRNSNLLRGLLSARLKSALFGFGFDRVDTNGILGPGQRSVIYGSLSHELPAGIWGQAEVRRTSVRRDAFDSASRTDWVARLRKSFAGGWHADVIAGSGYLKIEQFVPEGEPDSLFPELNLDAQQLTFRGARATEGYRAIAVARFWGGETVPTYETEAVLEFDVGPLSVYGSGSYVAWDEFNTAAGYAGGRLRLPLGVHLLAEVEGGERGLINENPVPRVKFDRWTVGGELRIGTWSFGGKGGRWGIEPSPALGVPFDTGGALPGGTVGIVEAWAGGKLLSLFGGALTAAGRYRTRDPGFFYYWPQTDLWAEGKYHLRMFEDQLEVILRAVGGVRGTMRIPNPDPGGDPVISTPDLNWVWSEVIVRVRDARVFLTYELFDSEIGPGDIPGFSLPRGRTHFGVKWEFWN